MNGTENHHLSPDMIEDAALGRLPIDRRAEANAHLATCARCREAVEQERLIAAGARSWGHAALKQRLQERIAGSAQQRIPWPHILGAAALVVVIVGVGILFRWTEPASHRDVTFSDTTAAAPAPSADKALPPRESETSPRDEAVRPSREKKDAAEDKALTAPSLMLEKPKEEPPAMAAAPAAEEAATVGAGQEELWLNGSLVADAMADMKQFNAVGASTQGISRDRLEARKGAVTTAPSSPVFIIRQAPREPSLNDRLDLEHATVPTLVLQSGDTLFVTIFLDSLLSPGELRSAFGRQVTQDSFQVHLPTRILGYRMSRALTR